MVQDLLVLIFIQFLLNKTKYKIISLDDYSSGKKKSSQERRVKYINCHTKDINKVLFKFKKKIKTIFHFGILLEFIKVLFK